MSKFIELTFVQEGANDTYKSLININSIASVYKADYKSASIITILLNNGTEWNALESYEDIKGLLKKEILGAEKRN